MTAVSDLAKANAIQFEVKKDGLTQRQSGDWQLRLIVAGIEMDDRLTKAAMGTRFACVMVEVNDDETPVDHIAMERDKWRTLGPAKQAGIRCKDPIFWAFLKEERQRPNVRNEDTAAIAVREICDVQSRSDFSKPGFDRERILWYGLDDNFRGWKARENA